MYESNKNTTKSHHCYGEESYLSIVEIFLLPIYLGAIIHTCITSYSLLLINSVAIVTPLKITVWCLVDHGLSFCPFYLLYYVVHRSIYGF